MIWLTWRQHRAETLVLGCILLTAVAGLVLVGLAMSHTFDQLGLGTCTRPASGSCAEASSSFDRQFAPTTLNVTVFLTLLPGVVGMFVGAPMVAREVDRRTHWLVWSQDVSRGRWLLVKSAGLLLLGVSAVGIFTVTLTWTLGTVFRLGTFSRLEPFFFDVQGVVPVAAAVFALTLGMAAGTLTRRTLPAMLIVIVLFGVVRFTVAQARFHYPPDPVTVAVPLSAGPMIPAGAWEIGFPVLLDPQANRVETRSPCAVPGPVQPACAGYRFIVAYQPADRFWRFQAIESGIYVVLAALLLALTAYWVRRLTV